MKLILLPGNNRASNEPWIKEVEEKLKPLFDKTQIQIYQHWKENRELVDLEHESKTLAESVKEETIIFAKSAGAIIALKCLSENNFPKTKCILAGMPISWCRSNNIPIEEFLSTVNNEIFFIQNSEDFAFSFKDLKELLEKCKVKNYRLIETQGNTHEYNDLDKIKEIIQLAIRR